MEKNKKTTHKIILYRTEHCPYCHMTAEFFRQNNIKFEEVWVDKDREKALEMIMKSGQTGVPVIDIDGNIVVGFDVVKLKQLLGI